jgi:hypothetical protein
MDKDLELIETAKQVRERAYAPYSRFSRRRGCQNKKRKNFLRLQHRKRGLQRNGLRRARGSLESGFRRRKGI